MEVYIFGDDNTPRTNMPSEEAATKILDILRNGTISTGGTAGTQVDIWEDDNTPRTIMPAEESATKILDIIKNRTINII